MTVSTTIRKAGPFAGTGLVSSYPFAFKVFTDDDLLVIRTPTGGADVTLVLASDYTVTLNPDQDAVPGGSVVLSAALAVGFTLSIGSQVDSLQGLSLTNNGGFFPKAIEAALDKLDIQDQQQEEVLSRAVRVPFGSGAIPDLPAPSAGSALVWNTLGTALENGTPGAAYDTLRSDLLGTGAGQGDSQVGSKRTASGAIATTVEAEIEALPLDAVVNFSADNTGTTNSTAALLAFYTAAILHGSGHIPSGRYKISRSVLAFDNGHVDTDFPMITTDSGVEFFVDSVTPGTVGPLLAFTNGTAVSGAGKFWKGGYHGSIQLTGIASATPSYTSDAEHGMKLLGLQEVRFGLIYGYKLGGAVIWSPETLFGATNPDPYHVGLCTFEGIKSEYCAYAIYNLNWVGLTNTTISTLRAIGNRQGVIYGPGTTTKIETMSAGTCAGWVIDDGTAAASTGGAPSRLYVGMAELDDCENGFYFNKMSQWRIDLTRFVHRYNFTAWNPAGGYWPRKVMHLGAGTAASCANGRAYFIHRIEAGGALGDLGGFIDCASTAQISDVIINNRILDNAALGVTGAMLGTNVSANSKIQFQNDGVPCIDTWQKVACLVRSSTADTVPNAGYAAAGAKITFGTELYDRGAYYDSTNSWFTVPYSGLYRFSGQICLTVAAGTRVRMAIATDTAGVIALQKQKNSYQTNAGAEHHQIDGVVSLTAGQRVFLMADQNTASATVALSAPISTTADLTWSIEAL
jgi:hypothetical protein